MSGRVYRHNDDFPPGTIYIGRGSVWDNPYRIGSLHAGKEIDRNMACDLFEIYARKRLRREPDWLKPLRGKNVWCFCAPLRCHGDTILRLLEEEGQ